MAQWRDFNASNEEQTCLWCGNKLRAQYEWVQGDFEARVRGEKAPRGAFKGYGDYEDGFFCGLRCAYQFARAMAVNGRRLNPKVSR